MFSFARRVLLWPAAAATSVSRAYGVPLIRLQCYQGHQRRKSNRAIRQEPSGALCALDKQERPHA
jgi:hypothetical protein